MAATRSLEELCYVVLLVWKGRSGHHHAESTSSSQRSQLSGGRPVSGLGMFTFDKASGNDELFAQTGLDSEGILLLLRVVDASSWSLIFGHGQPLIQRLLGTSWQCFSSEISSRKNSGLEVSD